MRCAMQRIKEAITKLGAIELLGDYLPAHQADVFFVLFLQQQTNVQIHVQHTAVHLLQHIDALRADTIYLPYNAILIIVKKGLYTKGIYTFLEKTTFKSFQLVTERPVNVVK